MTRLTGEEEAPAPPAHGGGRARADQRHEDTLAGQNAPALPHRLAGPLPAAQVRACQSAPPSKGMKTHTQVSCV